MEATSDTWADNRSPEVEAVALCKYLPTTMFALLMTSNGPLDVFRLSQCKFQTSEKYTNILHDESECYTNEESSALLPEYNTEPSRERKRFRSDRQTL